MDNNRFATMLKIICSLQMATIKFVTQALANTMDSESFKPWYESFENIEKEYYKLMNELEDNANGQSEN